jgi:SulP family sulfate permease
MQITNQIHFRNLKGDLFGGLTAAVVALPLALAFGVSSGAGAITGLYGAIFVGVFAALCGGTPAQVSGPTGPMTVVMASVFTGLIAQYPETGLAMSFTVVMLGGLFQILFGVLNLGTYITLMPYTVISGFMSGIGIIIIALQIGPFFGYPGSASVLDSIKNLPSYLGEPNLAAVVLGLVTLVIVFTWPRRFERVIPSPLFALVVGTILSLVFFPDANLKVIGEIPSALPSPNFPTLQWDSLRTMLGYSLMLATLGAIDSLLTSLVADNITRTEHDPNRELVGQGIGNVIAGLFGGLPGAGATMRTVVNVQAGGRTPLSGMVHGFLLLVIMLGAARLTEPIPHAVLAGILIKVGIDILDWSFLKRAHYVSIKATILMYGVLFLTVFVDLITAVGVGVFVANILTIERLNQLQSRSVKAITDNDDQIILTPEEKKILDFANGRLLLFHLSGPMLFGVAKAIAREHNAISGYDVLLVDLSEVPVLGVTSSLALENAIQEAIDFGREVIVVGATGKVRQRLEKLGIAGLIPDQHWMGDRLEALQEGLRMIRQKQSLDTEENNNPYPYVS